MTVVLINAALIGLLLLVVARAGVAFRHPRTRIAWLAAVIGALALMTQGTIVPLSVLDGILGGSNVLKLVQAVLTMVALWLGMQAGTAPATARVSTLRWWVPALIAAVFVAVFVAIPDRGATSFTFVETGAETYTAVWLYGVVHMTGIAVIGFLLFLSARASLRTSRYLFRVGAIAIFVACASEIVDLTLTRFAEPVALVTATFDPLFYLGVLGIVGGAMVSGAATRRVRRRGQALHAGLVDVARERGVSPFAATPADTSTDDRLYALRVGIEDDAITTSRPLAQNERDLLAAVDAHLTRPASGALR